MNAADVAVVGQKGIENNNNFNGMFNWLKK